jgi:hypothetical protein
MDQKLSLQLWVDCMRFAILLLILAINEMTKTHSENVH